MALDRDPAGSAGTRAARLAAGGPGVPPRPPDDALARLWGRISRPLEPEAALTAVLGVERRRSRALVNAVVAGSPESERLLTALPNLLRGLSISSTSVAERTAGHLRGPVLWSETNAARAASGGDTAVFVCSVTGRAYDTPENHALVQALSAIRRGGELGAALAEETSQPGGTRPLDVLAAGEEYADHDLFVRARHNAAVAGRFLEHRTLAGVSRRCRVTPRALQRVRSGGRRRLYAPVLDMLELLSEPLSVEHLRSLCDRRTAAQHDLLVGCVQALVRRGLRPPPFHVVNGSLIAGAVRFRHPELGSRPGEPTGVQLGNVLMDVPDPLHGRDLAASRAALAARAGQRRWVLVNNRADIDDTVARMICDS